jgi:hypothetical protein
MDATNVRPAACALVPPLETGDDTAIGSGFTRLSKIQPFDRHKIWIYREVPKLPLVNRILWPIHFVRTQGGMPN